jgi:hypothetical protein
MSETDTSADADTTVEQTTTNDDDDDYTWCVEEDGMFIAKDNYEYVLGMHGLAVTFDGVRSPDNDHHDGDDGEWELRDGYDTQGYFNPNAAEVPESVAMAFHVLGNEI